MRSLESRLKEYETRINLLTTEINRLNEFLSSKSNEIQGNPHPINPFLNSIYDVTWTDLKEKNM